MLFTSPFSWFNVTDLSIHSLLHYFKTHFTFKQKFEHGPAQHKAPETVSAVIKVNYIQMSPHPRLHLTFINPFMHKLFQKISTKNHIILTF